MADSKISALSAITTLATTDELAIASSGASKKITAANLPGAERDYVTRNTDLTVSATSAATADTFITGSSVSYNGSTRIKVEVYVALITTGNASDGIVNLWEDSTDLGRIAQVSDGGTGGGGAAVYGVRFLTPSNASHTYTVKAWKGGTIVLNAASPFLPSFLRITVA